MPINTLYDHERRLIKTTCSGKIGHQDFFNYQKTAWLEPNITGFNELIDFSDADLSDICFSDLITIAQKTPKIYSLSKDSKLALVTSTDHQKQQIEFYISARSIAEASDRPTKNFNSLSDALNWLL